MNHKNKLFQKSIIATLTAMYVGTSGVVIAEPGVKKIEGTSFYEPTFTAEDIEAVTKQRQDFLQGNVFVGKVGTLNQAINKRTPEEIFQPEQGVSGKRHYIVQLNDEPLASYTGGIDGLTPTVAPQNRSLLAKGRVNVKSAAAVDYKNYLTRQQDSFISRVQNAGAAINVQKRYTLANNAMLVEMNQQDAMLMAQQPGVKRITPNRIFELRTDRGPEFIGADRIWDGSQTDDGIGAKGEGMVVGIIDTGINTDHVAFAGDEEYSKTNPFGAGVFVGDCVEDPTLCNDKLIGVRSYSEITDVYSAPEFQEWPWQQEMIRPANGEDYNGHGSHVASTAAGNVVENTPLQTFDGQATSDGVDLPFNFEKTSGVAPRAHVISYQVCWPGGGGDYYAGCPESAILSAFEDAIADGVDTINFSIGGSEAFPWDDPMELAFLSAREAGISVATAAGNSGPNFWSADHSSPWVTTVGATSHDRVLEVGKTAISNFESDGASWTLPWSDIEGKGFTEQISGEFILASSVADPDLNDGYSAYSCNVPFPEGTFTAEQIVVCERGDIARVDKAKNVAAGGAGGIVLLNTMWNQQTVADKFVIPGINVASNARWNLENWINNATAGAAKATINAATNEYYLDENMANNLAPFSSMGPSRTNNTLVPDLVAPGVQIYAANADDQPFTQYPSASDWTFLSGTSMASPHVAGAMTLLSQTHPDWTPAEIQSALMLTAGDVWLSNGFDRVEPYFNFMAGAGSIDVTRANNTGLVMDETIENYLNANPRNGGYDNWLNLPSMVEMECERTCTWMRTVKATKDGSWTVTGVGKEEGVEISVSPSSFTLKAGETQAIVVRASLPDIIQAKVEPNEPGDTWDVELNNEMIFNGQVILTEDNANAPDVHMPIVAANVTRQLPLSHDIDITRDQGSDTIYVNTDNYSQLTPRYFGLVKPEVHAADLVVVGPFVWEEDVAKGWDINSVVVPEGAKRLVAEVQKVVYSDAFTDKNPRLVSPSPMIAIGLDKNGNGGFAPSEEDRANGATMLSEYRDEIVCLSSSMTETNHCNLLNPEAGNYWVATIATGLNYDEDLYVETGIAVVDGQTDNGHITVTASESHDGNGDYPLTISWNIPDSKEGEKYYGGFDLGNTEGAEGTLGFTALNLTRMGDAVKWEVSQTNAKALDVLDVTMKLAANLESDDRNYNLAINLPEGLRLAPSTIRSNHEAIQDAIVATENGLTLTGTQLSTRHVERDYVMTTNLTDAQCHTPLIDEYSTGGYIDLFGEFRIQPNAEWMVGDHQSAYDVPINWLFWNQDASFKVYNQENAGYMRMHAVGAMQFNEAWWLMGAHRGPGFLYESLAPFWRGSFTMDYMRHWEDPRGLTIASQYAAERPDLGDLVFLEFDNVKDKYTGDEFDFQMILRSGIDYHQGMPEIIYAYDNLGADVAQGVVMIEGFDSPFARGAGPKDGYLSKVLGFDNLDEVLEDDLVVCFDYVGPEQSEIELSFKVAVQPQATGLTKAISFDYDLEGQDSVALTHEITVNGNLKIADIEDMSVEENGRIDGIEVFYVDGNKVPNTIEVTGEGISAEVDGDMFNLIPNADFHGETEVTVTVRDIEHAGDSASTSFMLTVISDGIEKGCTDSTANNFDANANQDDGSCEYPQLADKEEPESKSSGGSMFWLLIAMAGLIAGRRIK
ncbi:S8 family serine peptidase [Thalassotalea ponticola]|uniref:S8 family serine peptidase n=1 Tax=Thalassotalea ponticola TaxID=1523392 RepID=UPI0025B4439E|nr:S8 family serine peptidase [Thalassotalea ponticola]MDN3652001.1 S8 family serine peptidase [Thalassotalea ponticola]